MPVVFYIDAAYYILSNFNIRIIKEKINNFILILIKTDKISINRKNQRIEVLANVYFTIIKNYQSICVFFDCCGFTA